MLLHCDSILFLHLKYKRGVLGRYMNCAPLPPLRTTHFALRTVFTKV